MELTNSALETKLAHLFDTMEASKSSIRREAEDRKLSRRRYWWQEQQTTNKHTMKKPEITPGKYLVSNDKAIAALPDLLEALERAVSIIEDLPHPANIPAQDLRQALVKAGYTFE